MNEEKKPIAYEQGWDAFWSKRSLDSNPYLEQELADEWVNGWLTAKNAQDNEL